MLEACRQHVAERDAEGVVPKPLNKVKFRDVPVALQMAS